MSNLLPLLLTPAIMMVALKPLYNNNIDNGTAAPPAAAAAAANNRTNRVVPSNRLLRLRQNFNATGVRREARSASTFDGHQRNNIRFLLYIYGNKPE